MFQVRRRFIVKCPIHVVMVDSIQHGQPWKDRKHTQQTKVTWQDMAGYCWLGKGSRDLKTKTHTWLDNSSMNDVAFSCQKNSLPTSSCTSENEVLFIKTLHEFHLSIGPLNFSCLQCQQYESNWDHRSRTDTSLKQPDFAQP